MSRFTEPDRDEIEKERINFDNRLLHYGLYRPRGSAHLLGDIPWHWHEEFEFGQVLSGSILYRTQHHAFLLRAGDGIFINASALHALYPKGPPSAVKLQSQFFDTDFLAGAAGSPLDIRYITPVKRQKQLEAVPLYREEAGELLEKLREGERLGRQRELFYELRLRTLFSQLWETVYSWAIQAGEGETDYNALEDERIKELLSYVQGNYSEKIAISDLASCVHISQRECYRIFQESFRMTPVDYILAFRIQKAQELLLHTDKSILEVAMETGFGSGSYFGRIFKRYHGVTPSRYRKMAKQEETALSF
ncbi:MAG: AraC family transcriptional regulator [Provencibacterium sp.]|nr:AraC family transcriptional regulator [Provencibacterium sp.]